MHTHTHTHTQTHTDTRTCTHRRTHTLTHTHTRIHTFTHTHNIEVLQLNNDNANVMIILSITRSINIMILGYDIYYN